MKGVCLAPFLLVGSNVMYSSLREKAWSQGPELGVHELWLMAVLVEKTTLIRVPINAYFCPPMDKGIIQMGMFNQLITKQIVTHRSGTHLATPSS